MYVFVKYSELFCLEMLKIMKILNFFVWALPKRFSDSFGGKPSILVEKMEQQGGA